MLRPSTSSRRLALAFQIQGSGPEGPSSQRTRACTVSAQGSASSTSACSPVPIDSDAGPVSGGSST